MSCVYVERCIYITSLYVVSLLLLKFEIMSPLLEGVDIFLVSISRSVVRPSRPRDQWIQIAFPSSVCNYSPPPNSEIGLNEVYLNTPVFPDGVVLTYGAKGEADLVLVSPVPLDSRLGGRPL